MSGERFPGQSGGASAPLHLTEADTATALTVQQSNGADPSHLPVYRIITPASTFTPPSGTTLTVLDVDESDQTGGSVMELGERWDHAGNAGRTGSYLYIVSDAGYTSYAQLDTYSSAAPLYGHSGLGAYGSGVGGNLRLSAQATVYLFGGGASGTPLRGLALDNTEHMSYSTTGAPSVAAGAQASAASAVGGSTDNHGALSITTVASPAAGALAVVTFAHAYTVAPKAVLLCVNGTTFFAVQPSAIATTGFTVSLVGTALPAGSTAYTVSYWVMP